MPPLRRLRLVSSSRGSSTVGEAPGAPLCPDFAPPFKYGGEIYSVTIDVSGDLIEDDAATLRRLMARQ